MRVELIELLRCPNQHEPTPLVTVASARDGAHLLEGMLGCPVCHAEFALRQGGVDLRNAVNRISSLIHDAVATSHVEPTLKLFECRTDIRPHDATRTAALLNLADAAGAKVALCGSYGVLAPDVETLTSALCIAVTNRARSQRSVSDATSGPAHVSHLMVDNEALLPMANASLNAMALDEAFSALLADVARVVCVGGRVLAPVGVPVPADCKELARDATEWVAEVVSTATTPVVLARRLSSA